MRDINNHRIYVFIRRDETVKRQVFQGAHAVDERPRSCTDLGSPNISYLIIDNEQALRDVMMRMDSYKIDYRTWNDPDDKRPGELQSIVTAPLTRREGSVFNMYRPWMLPD